MKTANFWETNNEYWLGKTVPDARGIGCGIVLDASILSLHNNVIVFGPEMPTGWAGRLPTLWHQRESIRAIRFSINGPQTGYT